MKISVAQTRPIKGNISANIDVHKKLIQLAISNKADAIFFPELSITGYEPDLVKDLATNQDDPLFDDFQKISDENKITIGIGVPTKANLGIRISMIIFQPNQARQTYSKQKLHSDEFPYFVAGDEQIILKVNNKNIGLSICYESMQFDHAEHTSKLGADIYLASVAKTQEGVDNAESHYPLIATKFGMPVLMSNFVGFCDNFENAGQSAVWSKNGNLIEKLDDKQEGILIFDTESEEVIKQTLQN